MTKTELIPKKRLTLYGMRTTWRWRITAANGKIVGASTEWYYNEEDAKYNMLLTYRALFAFLKYANLI